MTVTIEGEVVTSRRRERNSIRSLDVLPPDVETKVVALRRLDGAAQVAQVTAMLSHSRTGLLAAIAAQDLPEIAEWKAKASAIQDMTKQLQLGRDLQLDAAEFLRRAERGLGVAIRDGQERGVVETPEEGKARGSAIRDQVVTYDEIKPKPTDFASKHEFTNTHGGIYDLTDGVSPEAFEQALAEAREEENLSRANLSRKCKDKSSETSTVAPKKVRKTAGARKVIEDLVVSISGLVFIVNDTDPAEVDLSQHVSDIEGIRQGLNVIRRFLNNVEQEN